MSPETLCERWLSLRFWLNAVVLPLALGVLAGGLLGFAIGLDPKTFDIAAGVGAALAVGLGLFRGVDILSARMVHDRLLRDAAPRYRACLAPLSTPPSTLRETTQLVDWLSRELLT